MQKFGKTIAEHLTYLYILSKNEETVASNKNQSDVILFRYFRRPIVWHIAKCDSELT